MNDKITLVAVGPIKPETLDYLCRAISEVLHAPCHVGAGIPLPSDTLNAQRGQYSADAIVNRLPPGGRDRVLGVVDRDAYVPDLNFVFGLADPQGKRALIALPRLRETTFGREEDLSLFLERAAKEAIHELGHTYGLPHCADRRCIMSFSNVLADTDYKGREFCATCERRLRGGQRVA